MNFLYSVVYLIVLNYVVKLMIFIIELKIVFILSSFYGFKWYKFDRCES